LIIFVYVKYVIFSQGTEHYLWIVGKDFALVVRWFAWELIPCSSQTLWLTFLY